MGDDRRIQVGRTADGEPVTLPVIEVLTGRAFITGKSGAGKSNTVSVVLEELLEEGYPVLIVDAEGEYYGLKEAYELLHAGADEECDIQVGPEHAEKIAGLALEENVPVILDVSGYLDEDEADALVRETARSLFVKEKKLKKPFLLVVEEVHEYVPEGGGMNEAGRMLIKVGKRGRKHGLGIVGVSQRPADVKKDFITQANWLVWHRLTWENDTNVVGRVVGDEYADAAPDLGDGQAFVQRDWTDEDVARVQFDRKRTFDAGATPGLDDFERPELKSVSDALVGDLQEISDQRREERNRIEELEREVEAREARIDELEDELETARNVSHAARQLASALSNGAAEKPFGYEQRLDQKNERIRALEAELDALRESGSEEVDAATEDDGEMDATASGDGESLADTEPALDREPTAPEPTAEPGPGTEPDPTPVPEPEPESERAEDPSDIDGHLERLRRKGERLEPFDEEGIGPADGPGALVDLLNAGPVVAVVDDARRESRCNHEHAWTVLAVLAAHGPIGLQSLSRRVESTTETVASFLSELRTRSLVSRDPDGRYTLDEEALRRLAEDGDERLAAHGELARQWHV